MKLKQPPKEFKPPQIKGSFGGAQTALASVAVESKFGIVSSKFPSK